MIRFGMKIATLNLWGTRGPAERRGVLLGALRDFSADILCLQEATDESLLEESGFSTRLTASQSGLALLSRFPAKSHEVRTYAACSTLETYHRGFLLVELSLESFDLWIAVTHLAWQAADEPTRLKQVEELLRWTASLKKGGLLLAGDFNAEPHSPPVRRIVESGFVDLWARFHSNQAGITWDNANPFIQSHAVKFPDRRIDYLFLCQEALPRLTPVACEVACDKPQAGLYPSDHYGVLVHFA